MRKYMTLCFLRITLRLFIKLLNYDTLLDFKSIKINGVVAIADLIFGRHWFSYFFHVSQVVNNTILLMILVKI